jgi:hypothetical protein
MPMTAATIVRVTTASRTGLRAIPHVFT